MSLPWSGPGRNFSFQHSYSVRRHACPGAIRLVAVSLNLAAGEIFHRRGHRGHLGEELPPFRLNDPCRRARSGPRIFYRTRYATGFPGRIRTSGCRGLVWPHIAPRHPEIGSSVKEACRCTAPPGMSCSRRSPPYTGWGAPRWDEENVLNFLQPALETRSASHLYPGGGPELGSVHDVARAL